MMSINRQSAKALRAAGNRRPELFAKVVFESIALLPTGGGQGKIDTRVGAWRVPSGLCWVGVPMSRDGPPGAFEKEGLSEAIVSSYDIEPLPGSISKRECGADLAQCDRVEEYRLAVCFARRPSDEAE